MYRKICAAVFLAVLCTVGSISAQAQGWTQVPGTLAQIVVGSSKDVWGLNSAGSTYVYNGGGGWIQIPGTLSQISASGDYTILGVNSSNQVWVYSLSKGTWKSTGFSATKVYTAGQYIAWGLVVGGGVGRYDPGSNTLDTFTTPLTQLSLSADGNLWGLTATGAIYTFNQQTQQFE